MQVWLLLAGGGLRALLLLLASGKWEMQRGATQADLGKGELDWATILDKRFIWTDAKQDVVFSVILVVGDGQGQLERIIGIWEIYNSQTVPILGCLLIVWEHVY